ncbi:ATP synthase F1 subunit epsilon [Candidatus Epulonipiscium viviparus]|uniref:ATP synthase F1 subunit epsilon n=1 Tax=Candidatus Epulonipiscium viviparus TaxID=420336 RepID=UPI00016C0ED1|nr:ATP synthase F1 subunit epsilon [Candidatus Epulopiscium viviparus]
MANQIKLEIITPTRQVFNEMVDMVVLKTTEGEMGVMYDHEPVVTLLSYGIIRYKVGGEKKEATTMSGFAEVTKDKVTILTDASELEGEINKERAESAKERAEGHMGDANSDHRRAEIALQKALIRLRLK